MEINEAKKTHLIDKEEKAKRLANNRKKNKDKIVIVILVILLLALIGLYISVIKPVSEKIKYDSFVNEITQGFSQSKSEGGVKVSMTEGEFILDDYAAEYFYSTVLSYGMGMKGDEETDEKAVTLVFTNGTKLIFGYAEVPQGVRKGREGLLMKLIRDDGKEYKYISDIGKFSNMRMLFLEVLEYSKEE